MWVRATQEIKESTITVLMGGVAGKHALYYVYSHRTPSDDTNLPFCILLSPSNYLVSPECIHALAFDSLISPSLLYILAFLLTSASIEMQPWLRTVWIFLSSSQVLTSFGKLTLAIINNGTISEISVLSTQQLILQSLPPCLFTLFI